MVAEEPIRSFNTGPNLLLVWVIKAAATYSDRLIAMQAEGSEQTALITQLLAAISAVSRIECLREPLKRVSLRSRPSTAALQMASRTRRAVYGKAVSAYLTLSGVESGNKEVLRSVLARTLCGPLEMWRRLELAVALGIGTALEHQTGSEMHLSVLGNRTDAPILVCGEYELFWQGGGGLFMPSALEPSEQRVKTALAAYGMQLGYDRPDLVLINRPEGRVRGIIEVKYSKGDSLRRSFREATEQIVRYARGFVPSTAIDKLVRASLVVLSGEPPALINEQGAAPRAVSFAGLTDGRLDAWLSERVIPAQH
ncbi:MAG: hypothetical protein OXN89_27285 [Bryobacterales bacterium]|nr:hypothetical protein [Bryobacterales bacterium]